MKNESSLLIKYSNLFRRQFKAVPLEVKIAFRQARELFMDNPNHPSLRNHELRNELAGYRSIDITGDYRALYKIKMDGEKEIITFYMLGTHEDLYGSKRSK